jgi:hypothetical protein
VYFSTCALISSGWTLVTAAEYRILYSNHESPTDQPGYISGMTEQRMLRGDELVSLMNGQSTYQPVFFVLASFALLFVLGCIVLATRDAMCAPVSREGRREEAVSYGIGFLESHICRLVTEMLRLDIPKDVVHLRYLDSLAIISPVYSLVRLAINALVYDNFPQLLKRAPILPLSVAWMMFSSRIINFIAAETLLTFLFLDDKDFCSYANEYTCTTMLRMHDWGHMCEWNKSIHSCGRVQANSVGLGLCVALAVLSSLLAIPLNIACDALTQRYKEYCESLETSRHLQRSSVRLECRPSGHFRLAPVTAVRAARLARLQRHLDGVPESAEVELILSVLLEEQSLIDMADCESYLALSRTYLLPDPVTAHIEDVKIVIERSVSETRSQCEKLIPLIASKSDRDRELFLTGALLTATATSSHFMTKRLIVNSVLFGVSSCCKSSRVLLNTTSSYSLAIASVCLLIAYIVGCCLGLYTFGVRLSPQQSELWLWQCLSAFIITILVIQPAYAFMFDYSAAILLKEHLEPAGQRMMNRVEDVLVRLRGQMNVHR